MKIGEVIRKYRIKKNMTQEEIANYIGVTTPAVNKWENGISHPDIMLLAPIARLLDINLDTLLSFEKELSTEEVNYIILEMNDKFKNQTFEEVFQWAKKKINQYPNCEQLIWQIALILDSKSLMSKYQDEGEYEDFINNCYKRLLNSKDENIKNRAADSLFGFYFRKNNYKEAEKYLSYFSIQNPERKLKQAFIYSETNRVDEAYKNYEELLLSGYNMINMVLQNIFTLTMNEGNNEKAHILITKQIELSKIFEMGEYHENSIKLDLAIVEKDSDMTIELMKKILSSVQNLNDFTKSSLYEHIKFKKLDSEFITEVYNSLLIDFSNEETYYWLKTNPRWKEFIEENSRLSLDVQK